MTPPKIPDPKVSEPSLVVFPDGSSLISWMWYDVDGDGGGIYCQHFNSDGTPSSEVIRVSTTTAGSQYEPFATLFPDGNVFISWQSSQENGSWDFWGIYAQILNPSGDKIGSEIHVNSYEQGFQLNPKSLVLSDGRIVVTWESNGNDSAGGGYVGRILDPLGTPLGADFLIGAAAGMGDQGTFSLTATGPDTFCVSWQNTNDGNLYLQNFDSNGTPSGFTVSILPPLPAGSNSSPSIICDPNGNIVLAFDYRPVFETTSASDVYLTVVSASGEEKVAPFIVNSVSDGYQYSPRLITLSDGTYGALWIDNYSNIAFQHISSSFQLMGAQKTIINSSSNFTNYDAHSNPNGGFSIVFLDSEVSAVVNCAEDGTILNSFRIGTDNSDSIVCSDSPDFVYSYGGNDTVSSDLGNDLIDTGDDNDQIYAGGGADTVCGGSGNDIIRGGIGDDSLDGGSGNDVLFSAYGAPMASYTRESDAFTTVQNLVGLEQDTLIGGTGNDTLYGGSGNDVLYGGEGIDTASYSNATAGVTVSLAVTAAQNTLGAGTDTLATVENLTGSGFSDILTGSASANRIIGGAGNDKITGGGGADSLTGGTGNDTVLGGNGNDTATGSGGNDKLTGGAGADTFVFNTLTGVDHITDFTSGTDHIALAKSVMTAIGPIGALTADAFWTGTAAHDASDRLIYNKTTGAVYYDADGNGSGAAVKIAVLDGHPPLAYTDVLVF